MKINPSPALLAMSVVALACAEPFTKTGNELLAPLRASGAPGGAVIVIRDNDVVYSDAFGLADLAAGTPNTPGTNFRLASVTKQFTAMAVMILNDRGALTLNQTLTEFFRGFAEVGRSITVRHLLTHTSGLIDYEDVMPETTTVPVLDRDVLRLLENIDSTYFTPGSQFRYSNSGYALLALIVEQVSGMPFSAFLKKEIFDPLGMTGTVAYERGISEVQQRAYGYTPDSARPGTFDRTDQSMTSSVLGDGGIYSSVLDLRKWVEGIASGRLVSRKAYEQIFSHQATVQKDSVWYGYGWYLGAIDGEPASYHGGTTVGFRNFIIRIPDRRTTVILLCNRADARAEDIARRFATASMAP